MNTASSVVAVPETQTLAAKPRLAFIDNLRWTMIVLVVAMHAAVTYSHLGSWYFMEDPKPPMLTTVVFATFQVFLQAFFMGLLFFIAGYFVPGAFDRKGPGHFLRDRGVRLGLPSLLYMLAINPFINYWLMRNFADPSRPSLGHAYLPYLTSGSFLSGSGPMWFAVALLMFSAVYALVRLLGIDATRNDPQAQLPSHGQVVGFALAISVCAFLLRIVQPMGTNILNMQLCYFSQYIFLFAAGTWARRRDWLLRVPYAFGKRWLLLALRVGGALWILLVLVLLKTHTEDKLGGGLTWQSAAFSLWESFFSVGICLGLLVLFRDKFNSQGKVARWLSDNCFAVYVFHPPVLIAITLAMRELEAPKLLKFLVATTLAVTATYLASSLVFRRIPFLKRIL